MLMTRRILAVSVTTSNPATRAVPLVGSSRVVRILISVVFPAPLGPSRPKYSPGSTSRSTPPRAVTGSGLALYTRVTARAWMARSSGRSGMVPTRRMAERQRWAGAGWYHRRPVAETSRAIGVARGSVQGVFPAAAVIRAVVAVDGEEMCPRDREERRTRRVLAALAEHRPPRGPSRRGPTGWRSSNHSRCTCATCRRRPR